MATLYRRDECVVDHMGIPVSGVSIYVCAQPANVNIIPPSPAIKLYSDSLGNVPLTKPPQTDAYGHASYYTEPGTFTVCYVSPQIAGQILALPDQIISPPTNAPQYNSDSTAAGTITGVIDGSNRTFTLSAMPVKGSLVLMINGIVQYAYAFSGSTVVLETPPRPRDVVTANYQV